MSQWIQFLKGWYSPMLKKNLLFLFFQIKSVFRTLPRLILCTAILAVIVVIAGLCGNKILNSGQEKNTVNVTVAVVMPENDLRVNVGFNIIKNMDGIESFCTFVSTDMDTALDMMANGDVVAITYIPEGFVDGIMYGDNTPAILITPENAGIESLLFCSVIDAGSHTLAYVQSGIYSVNELLTAHNMTSSIQEAETALNEYYTKYALGRDKFFEAKEVSLTGNVSTAGYYICSGIVLLLLLSGLTVSGHFSSYTANVRGVLKRERIGDSYIRFSELFSVSLMFYALFAVVLIIAQLTFGKKILNMNIAGFLTLFLIILSIESFIMFINTLTENRLSSTLVIFISTAAMLYACGRIVPSLYLPDGVASIGNFLPVKAWSDTLEASLFGGLLAKNILYTLICALLFYGGSVLATKLRGRDK